MPSTLEVDALKNSGGTKTLAEVSGGEFVWGANVPSGTMRYFNSATYTTASTPPYSSPGHVNWADSQLSITVPAADVANCSKFYISVQSGMNVNPSTHVQVGIRIARFIGTSTSATVVGWNDAIGMNGDYTLFPNGNIFAIDSSLGTGDHTYKYQYRHGQSADNHATSIAYHRVAGCINYITVIGIA